MRALLVLIGLAALVVVILMALGMLTLDTKGGSLPTFHVEGGQAPAVKANVGSVSIGKKEKTIEVPTVSVTKAADGNSTAQ